MVTNTTNTALDTIALRRTDNTGSSPERPRNYPAPHFAGIFSNKASIAFTELSKKFCTAGA
ncbi:MAG: hypothetical protein Rhims3KO_36500 [Hyphomicrobiales bacterium]